MNLEISRLGALHAAKRCCSLAAGYESNCYFKAHDEKVVNIKVKVKVYTRVLAA